MPELLNLVSLFLPLSLLPIPTTVPGKQIQFRCGRLHCNGGGGFIYKIHEKDIFPEGCSKEEDIILLIISHSESNIENNEKESLKFSAIIKKYIWNTRFLWIKKTSEELGTNLAQWVRGPSTKKEEIWEQNSFVHKLTVANPSLKPWELKMK